VNNAQGVYHRVCIMPNKKNQTRVLIIRAKSNKLQGLPSR
jgi:argininosuccinate lyase